MLIIGLGTRVSLLHIDIPHAVIHWIFTDLDWNTYTLTHIFVTLYSEQTFYSPSVVLPAYI
jgi:hypothetical protein